MKPQLIDAKMRPSATKRSGSEAVLVFQDELVAAIHGAFEVAVEIAVREVKTLVGQATSNIYEELRQENESLKQRLQKAEAMLGTEPMDERSVSPPHATNQIYNVTDHTDELPYLAYNQRSPNHEVGSVHSRTEVRGDEPPAGHCHVIHPEDRHTSSSEEQRSSSDAASEPQKELNNACATEVTKEISHARVVKVEGVNPLCQDSGGKDCESSQLSNTDADSTLERVTVKQEKAEEESDTLSCCPESIKVEDFSLECVSAVQFKMEEWKTEEALQSPDPNAQLANVGMDQVHPPNSSTSLQPPTDVPSISSEFPNIFQLTEPAPLSEAPPQVYGVHVRTSRNGSHALATLYACKCCGQTFHLPSLLRRHHGQCQQRLQQRCHQPAAGSKRTRVQLYPPGCSPFRCTECNREFNRMENLKTHLRIHTGERPYTCSVCSKCFRHSGALTRHFRIHTGEKPYVCGQCGRSFRNCGGLRFHQRSHSKQI